MRCRQQVYQKNSTKSRLCKRQGNVSGYCYTHALQYYSVCCNCNSYCNKHSQMCGRCARRYFYLSL